MASLLYPLIVAAGILQAFGNPMNAQLRSSLQNPMLASFVSFALIVLFFAGAFMVAPNPLPTSQGIQQMPWWAPLGGLAGAVAVLLGLLFVGEVGAGTFNGILITANILASLVIDHFGWMHMHQKDLSPGRVAGGALMVAGIFLISRF